MGRKLYETIFPDRKLEESENMYKGDDFYDRLASDDIAMGEIELFAENDGNLYRQQFLPIVKNVKQKIKTGRYNHTLAPKLWMYYVENAMKMYAKEYGNPREWMNLLSTKDRKVLAQKLADYYYDQIIAGEYDF